MKKTIAFYSFIFGLAILQLHAQTIKTDVIYRTDNSTISGTILEITDDMVRYRKPNDATIYRLSTKDIQKIVYANGEVENYNLQASTIQGKQKKDISQKADIKNSQTNTSALKWMISGAMDLSHFVVDKASTTQMTLNPKVGYFFKPNILVGASISVKTDKDADSSSPWGGSGVWSESTRIVGAFGRYMQPLNEKTYVWGELGFGFGSYKVTEDDESYSFSASQFHIGPGVSFFLNKHVAIEAMLRYSHTGIGGQLKTNEVGLFSGIQIFF
ncbi:opacity protein-like surface antigen [Runella defluvii]|uniref:Opacity protein-like surface antigen n=1 Tax=Runella defluvii TaxID=370973 RepID=A0A7W6EU36_9BACT|nr:outer membrane beta-barrel protein [Runella defluvii]MBB3842011.1 opacity protein-like surface antigen [Runella defluvii]